MTQIVSRTCIKPSSPTPHNLKTFKLSLLDQLSLPIHGNTTFFFHADVGATTTNPNLEFSRKSQLLQQSISDTLTRFYPIVGRLLDASTINRNDDGGFFIEARCDSSLSFLPPTLKPNFETLDQFLPATDPKTLEWSKGSMWLIKFSCGTTVSVSLSHKIVDIASLLTLLKSWTETCRGLSEPILPNFTGFSLLPPKEIPGMSASMKFPTISSKSGS